ETGIGLATARGLHAEGGRVVVLDLDAAGGKRAAEEVDGHFVRCDVTDSADVAEAFRQAEQHLGRIDVAHMNAGVVSRTNDIAELSDEEFRRVTGVNVDGVVFGTREAARAMTRSSGGSLGHNVSL